MTDLSARVTEQSLTDDVVSATIAHTGYPEAHVRAFVGVAMAYLLREYGGDRLPKAGRRYPVEAIRAALDAGTPRRDVCRQYGIGMSTLYRIESGELESSAG